MVAKDRANDPNRKAADNPFPSPIEQMVKAGDLLKYVDLNDVKANTKEEFDALRTEPYGNKSETRAAKENELLAKKLNTTKKPGGFEGARGEGPSLHESIKVNGIERPLDVGAHEGRMTLWNGHHRLAAQMDIDPEAEVPVKFHEQPK